MSSNKLVTLVLLLDLIPNHTEKHCSCQHCRCRCHLYRLSYEVVNNEMLILLEKVYLERFYYELQKETLINLSDTEYSNNKFVYKYIQYFKR